MSAIAFGTTRQRLRENPQQETCALSPSLPTLFGHDRYNILVSYDMAQAHSLRYVSSTCTPHHCILESFLQRSMDLVAYLFDRGLVANDQRFTEIWVFSFSAYSLVSILFQLTGRIGTALYRSSSAAILASICLLRLVCRGRARSS